MSTFLFITLLIGTTLTALGGSDILLKSKRLVSFRWWFVLIGAFLTVASYFENDKLLTTRLGDLKSNTIDMVTGGESVCFMEFAGITAPDGSPVYSMSVNNLGNYPLYDVQMRIINMVDYPEFLHYSMDKLNSLVFIPTEETWFQVGNIPPRNMSLQRKVRLDPGTYMFYVNFSARNGVLHEKYVMMHLNGKWLSAIQVFRKRDGEYRKVYERIDQEFPVAQVDFLEE